jgi:HSP20 family protein
MTSVVELFPRFELTPWTRRSLFEPFFSLTRSPYFYAEENAEWVPPAEIIENDKQYTVTMELPGIDMKKLDISYAEGILTVKGEKKQEIGKDENCCCSERYSGSFQRRFRIPGGIKGEEIAATYKDGVLRVGLSKSEKSQVKKIEVKH